MVLCSAPHRCTVLKPDNEPVFNVEGIYKPGNIGMIYASVMQPFQYQIDEAKLSRVTTRLTAQWSRDEYEERESRANSGKLRPCIVLMNGPDEDDPLVPVARRRSPPVALLATFGNNGDISDFPRCVRHHLLPIHTSDALHLGTREHLHTTPDWLGGFRQYVIACIYQASAFPAQNHPALQNSQERQNA
jgi:hypothetical protein